ncbi:ABC transporter substrate-binding protein [Aminiphilus sp.]|jgi:branched-chain amino acid transport system substrate-binding protein|uniref:ABC transporter substrate-binding protein n=1 Tax=Aminiphilus sp. TaxID=1872488 RepID=UPI002613BFB4|nr:ABC transporter substrate-binding protein [Aminiphilus sp.]
MRRVLGVLAVISVLLGACVAWGAEEPIRIGYLATLTGEGSTWGQHEQDGAVMAVEEINAAGGLLGRKVELVIYDVKGRAEDAINAARRLVTQDKVVAIGGTNYSSLNIAARPIIQEAQVPMIGSATTNPVVTVNPDTNEPWPYSFRICFTDPYQGLVMASYLYQKLGLKTAAIIGDVGSDYSEGMKQYFIETFEKLGGTVAGSWGFRGGDVDFRAQLTEVKAKAPQALAMPYFYKEMALTIKQAAELDFHPVFIGGDGYSPNMYEIAGDAMEGSWWVSHFDYDDPVLQPVLEKYRKRYGKEATEIGNVVFAYDIIYWIADAIQRAGKAEGPAVRDALESTKDLKLTHFTLTLDPKTHNPLNKPAAILQFRKGKPVYVETWQPQVTF